MKIHFGLHLDGCPSPPGRSTLGEYRCGPAGLLALLELRLGLGGRSVSAARRTGEYLQLLRGAEADGERFYSGSLRNDEWAVAEALLRWRDDLVTAGWTGQAVDSGSPRLRDLAEVERLADGRFSTGPADRLRRVLGELDARDPRFGSVTVQEPAEVLPALWRLVLTRLGAQFDTPGFEPFPASAVSTTDPECDLNRFLLALSGAGHAVSSIQPRGDGSLFRMGAACEITLARAVARRLAATRQLGQRTVVIARDDARVLEEGLAAEGEPALGITPRSTARPMPQLVQLAIRLLWEPLDPQHLLEFLIHPACPVPRGLAHELVGALRDSPGIGGPRWVAALQRSQDRLRQRHATDAGALKDAMDRIDQASRDWIDIERFDPRVGAPAGRIVAVCRRLAVWAGARSGAAALPEADVAQFRILSSLATEMALVVEPFARLSRVQLDRMLEQVSDAGWPGAPGVAELGHVHRVAHPAALLEPADVVVWWDFREASATPRLVWNDAELSQLRALGVVFPSPKAVAAMERFWAEHALRAATGSVVLARAHSTAGTRVPPHPLEARLAALLPSRSILPGGEVDDVAATMALGMPHDVSPASEGIQTGLGLTPVALQPLPRLRRWWKLTRSIQPSGEQSYTSLEKLIYHPHAWALRYAARLRAGPLSQASIQEPQRIAGTLLHRLLDLLLLAEPQAIDWRHASREQLDAWIDSVWPVLLRQEGAGLLLPSRRVANAQLLQTARRALGTLVLRLREAGAVEANSNRTLEPRAFDDL